MRVLASIVVALGLIGIVVCVAGCVTVWIAGSRLDRASTNVFEMIDYSLSSAEGRVARLQQRALDARISANEIRQGVEDWAKKEAGQYVAGRLKLAEKTERLSAGLQQTDLLLEVSLESLQRARRAAELSSTLGAHLDPEGIDHTAGKLALLQAKVQEAIKVVQKVREHLDSEEGDSKAIREQVLRLVARIAITLGEADQFLEGVVDRLARLRAQSSRLQTQVGRSIVAVEIALSLLAAWMVAGQVMLCRWGWPRCRQVTSTGRTSA
ncbi:MAG: hypothetical protein K8T91_14995 [Planctomycetes bacterium]|nr:hypothetical protein [Planctomycetota bacterium]